MRLFGSKYADGQRLDLQGAPLVLRVNPRARRITLRIDPIRREGVVVAPTVSDLSRAVGFARERHAWLAARLARVPQVSTLADGDSVKIFDAPFHLRADGRRARLDVAAGALRGCGDVQIDPQLVMRAIKREALRTFQDRAAVHCANLGVAAPPIFVADTRSRWGSCSPARPGRAAEIRLSWRLALAPFAVADYVVAHECAHLVEANHSPRFWAHVTTLVGDERPHRAWLRTHGPSLHAFGKNAASV